MRRLLDLDDLLEANKKIYVRNNALKSHLLIIVQMQDASGRKRALKIPPTQFPINVSSQFSTSMIRESSDLRDALAKGILVLVEPQEAEKQLQDPDAQDELKSFALSVFADSAPDNAVRDNMARLKGDSNAVVDAASVLENDTLPNDNVSPRVQGLISSLTSKEKTSKEILVQLKRLKPTLSSADLTYIIRECEKEAQVREFAEGALADLSASE